MEHKVIPLEVLSNFEYSVDVETNLIWKTPPNRYGLYVRGMAGTVCKDGRHRVKYKGVQYLICRIIYFLHFPDADQSLEVDHIDNDPFNNKIENLRLATRSENETNKPGRNSSLGLKNIVIFKNNRNLTYYRVLITKNGSKYCRYFPFTDEGLQLAIADRDRMMLEMHGDFLNTKGP